MRIAAYGRTPWRFFRSGWNVFDFVIVAVAFVPGLVGLDDASCGSRGCSAWRG